MKRKLPLSLSAVLAAALLPGTALVGCKSTEVASADTASETGGAVDGSGIDIVRPATAEAAPVAEMAADGAEAAADEGEPKEKKKFSLFGGKKEETVAEAPPEAGEEASEPKRERRPLFGSKSKGRSVRGSEVAAVKEKKKFRLFGFGKNKDIDEEVADPEGAEEVADPEGAEEVAGIAAGGGAENEMVAIAQGPARMPWEDPAPEVVGGAHEDLPEGDTSAGRPETGDDTAAGVTARIRPGEASGGFSPLDATPASTALDRVPSLTADPGPVRPRDDGFMPLTPEPKFPAEEGILPPGN